MATTRSRVALLGATGSIGTQTLDVLREERDRFEVVAIAGGQRLTELSAIAKEFNVHDIGVVSERDRDELRALVGPGPQIVIGAEGLDAIGVERRHGRQRRRWFRGTARHPQRARGGYAPRAREQGVADRGGAPRGEGATTRPARRSCRSTPSTARFTSVSRVRTRTGHPDVAFIHLTASGGPFRGRTSEQLSHVTKEDALQHPTWTMGPKITVDSSTLMNKGLEVLEASALFGIEAERVNVVVHPQSVVHSMVEYVDGAVLAQLSLPDMRLPIAYCLGSPVRFAHAWGRLDFSTNLTLEFEAPDREVFRALDLAYAAARAGGAAPAWLSAANEIAVEAFLNDQLGVGGHRAARRGGDGPVRHGPPRVARGPLRQ